MSVIEKNALIRAKDATGDSFLIYPITKAENVDGLEEALAPLASSESVNNAKSEAISTALSEAKEYTDTQLSGISPIQFITWEEND